MSLDNLIAALSREADVQVESELERARAEAEAIAAGARERIARRSTDLAASRDAKRHTAVEAGLRAARREVAREVLDARRALLDRVFRTARPTLVDVLGTAAYRDTLPALVTEALVCLGDRQATLRCHSRILANVQGITAGRAGLRVEPDDTVGAGFRVIADDGSLEVDCTLEGRLGSRAPQLSLEVLEQTKECA